MTSQSASTRPRLDPVWLRRELLVGGGLWNAVEVVEETDSTNADVAAAARAGEPEGLVLVAEHQRAGRGRAGRSWTSPARAGIAVSVLLRPGPPVPVSAWGWLSLLAAVAAAEAVTGTAAVPAALKWPNDLLVAGRKCGGVLAEVTDDAVVVGTGINVTTRADELPEPEPGAPAATSLALAGARSTAREPLLVALLRGIESWYARWRAAAGGADECGLRAAYLAASATVGQAVRVLLPGGGELTGQVTAVDSDGRLVLRDVEGGARSVAAGDVLHVRT